MSAHAVSWNKVRGIHFSFGHHFGCSNKQWKLNAAFAQTLPNIASLFIVDEDGVETLRPDPIPLLKSLIVAAIVDELPASEVFKAHKQHIALLLSNSAIFCHKKDHTRFQAARRAHNGDPIIRLVLNIFSWEFHEDWYPYEFHKVYDPGYGVPLDEAMRKRPKTTRHAAAISTFPIKPVESEVKPTIQVAVAYTSESPNSTLFSESVLIPRAGASTVTANLGPLQPAVGPIANTHSVKAPRYIWTWTYSPNSELVSFRRVRSSSDSFLRATSSSPPVQRQEKSSIVTTPSVLPCALTRFGHHHVPPSVPANFGWTFNPQNEIATFRRLPKSVPASQPLSCIQLLPAEDTDLPNAALAWLQSLESPCHNQIFSRPNHPPVLRLSKRHQDAVKVKLYHLHANILSMNWFYDTFD
eukprot:jgi/Psemu1/40652/gm1.40652_g